jgi:hypothetical protein
MSNLYYFDPSWLPPMGLLIGLGLAALGWRIASDLQRIRHYRQAQAQRARGLRFSLMVERLGVGLPRYLRHASDTDLACRLFVCEHCRTLDRCDRYLGRQGEQDPRDFCPNYSKLVTLKRTTGHP